MKPSHFAAHQERRLGRPLTMFELDAVNLARLGCVSGNRNTIKAMWAALRTCHATIG